MTAFTLLIADPTTEDQVWFSVSDVLNSDRDWRKLATELLDTAALSEARLEEATEQLHNLRSKTEAQIYTAATPAKNRLHRQKVLAVIAWSLELVAAKTAEQNYQSDKAAVQ